MPLSLSTSRKGSPKKLNAFLKLIICICIRCCTAKPFYNKQLTRPFTLCLTDCDERFAYSADTRLKEHRDAMAVVSSDGTVLWIPMAIFKSTCEINIANFPFDTQTCILKFGSWTYNGFKLDIDFYDNLEHIDTSDYIKSNEWKLVDSPAKKNVKYYPCCIEPYPDLTFTLHLRRIAAFYNYILILPCVLLSSLTLVIFWLPPESPAKMILGMYLCIN